MQKINFAKLQPIENCVAKAVVNNNKPFGELSVVSIHGLNLLRYVLKRTADMADINYVENTRSVGFHLQALCLSNKSISILEKMEKEKLEAFLANDDVQKVEDSDGNIYYFLHNFCKEVRVSIGTETKEIVGDKPTEEVINTLFARVADDESLVLYSPNDYADVEKVTATINLSPEAKLKRKLISLNG